MKDKTKSLIRGLKLFRSQDERDGSTRKDTAAWHRKMRKAYPTRVSSRGRLNAHRATMIAKGEGRFR